MITERVGFGLISSSCIITFLFTTTALSEGFPFHNIALVEIPEGVEKESSRSYAIPEFPKSSFKELAVKFTV